MNIINKTKSRIENIDGVDETVVDSSDKVWIHIILEDDADESEVREEIESLEGLRINIESTYTIGEGILNSGRPVLQTHI